MLKGGSSMGCASVLIVGRPGPLRTGLQVLVGALFLEMISADDTESMFTVLAQCHPRLVLLDLEPLAAEAGMVMQQLKAGWPETRLVALADDKRQCQLARAAGADAVLLKGVPAGQLADVVQQLLASQVVGAATRRSTVVLDE